jgi:hypothetical protein
MKPETHVDLEEMRSDVTNCHPPAKNPTQQGGYVETKQPTYPREGRCVGRCVEDTGSLDWWYLLL